MEFGHFALVGTLASVTNHSDTHAKNQRRRLRVTSPSTATTKDRTGCLCIIVQKNKRFQVFDPEQVHVLLFRPWKPTHSFTSNWQESPRKRKKQRRSQIEKAVENLDLIALGTTSGTILLYSFAKGDLHTQLVSVDHI